MLHPARVWLAILLSASAVLASCGGHSARVLPTGNSGSPGVPQAGGMSAAQMDAYFPKSVSPHAIVPKAMPVTAKLPASAMNALTSKARSRMSVGPLNWTKLPGAATSVAISKSDGSLWALSTQPAGPDKYIWHYNGAWTNVPGLASSIAVDPNGDVYAVNSASGGVYELPAPNASSNTPNWSTLGGGALSVTAGVNEEAYVLSNGGITNGNSAIWKYANGWSQMPGAGSQIAGSFDLNTHTVGGSTMNPDGFFVLSSNGGIYYYSPTVGYIQFPGAAGSVAPSTGGVFALAYPPSSNGSAVYYYDYSTSGWSLQAGSGVALAANGAAGGAAPQLFLINASNQIWTTVAQTLPFTVTIAAASGDNAQTNPPNMSPSNANIYVLGQLPPGTPPVQWVYLTNASGAEAPFTGGAVPPIAFYGGSATSGNTSQTIQLPPLISARIYISNGPLSITSTSGPAPWNNDGSQNTYFDIVEYTWPSAISGFNVDTTQVNAMGLALSFDLIGAQNQSGGFLAGAVTQVHDAITALPSPSPSGNPWATLATSQWPYRVLSPDGAFTNKTFLDQQIQSEWDTFKSTWITVDSKVSHAGIPLYGQVDASENMNFYTSMSTAGAPYVTIPNPFPTVGASPNPYGFTQGATQYMVQQNGPFLLPASAGSGSWPGNAANAGVAANIGNAISTALNRGILGSSVTCPPPSPVFPASAAYENQYAAAIWNVAANPQYGYGRAYNIPYADQCNLSTDTSDPAPQSLSVTVHQS